MSARRRQTNVKPLEISGRQLNESLELSDNESETDDNKNVSQNDINSQSIGIKTTDEKQDSQTSVGSVEEWKGSQVINFKRFKKFSNNNIIKSEPKMIKLKIIPNNSYKEWLNSQIKDTDENKDTVLDNQKTNKRKVESKLDPIIDSVTTKKKSRH